VNAPPKPLKVTPLTGWYKDHDAYDPQARRREFTLEGVAEVLLAHSLRGEAADAWPMSIKYRTGRRYITTALNWHRLGTELRFLADVVPRDPETLEVPQHH
jgi:hypothetical protein